MKKNVKDVLFVELLILIFILILKIIVLENYPYLTSHVNALFWPVLAIILYFAFGFPKDKNYFKQISTVTLNFN